MTTARCMTTIPDDHAQQGSSEAFSGGSASVHSCSPLLHSAEHDTPAQARPCSSSALGSPIAWQTRQVRLAAVPRQHWPGRRQTAMPFGLSMPPQPAFVSMARACPLCVQSLPQFDELELLVAGARGGKQARRPCVAVTAQDSGAKCLRPRGAAMLCGSELSLLLSKALMSLVTGGGGRLSCWHARTATRRWCGCLWRLGRM